MIGAAAEIIATITTMAASAIARLISCANKPILILELKNHLKDEAKSTLVPTVKIEQALQVFPAKVKVRKPVPIDLLTKQPTKVLMLNQVKAPKTLALEIAKVQPHVVLDVESRDKYEYIY